MGSISPPEANPSSKWDGEADLKPLLVPIEELKHDSRQVRRHGERDLAQLRLSLEGHGQKKPVVVERSTGEVKAGNGTLEAARLLGWTHIAAVQSDDPAYLLRQYAIRDNRTAELSDWDPLPLLDELKDLEALGVELPELGWLDSDLAEFGNPDMETVSGTSTDRDGQGFQSGLGAMGGATNQLVTIGEIHIRVEPSLYDRLTAMLEDKFSDGIAYKETFSAVLTTGLDAQ